MAKSDLLLAVTQLAAERNLPHTVVVSAIEAALVLKVRSLARPGVPAYAGARLRARDLTFSTSST